MLSYDSSGPVVLVGGYGVVGAELARLLHRHHPDMPLVLAGRRPDRAAPLAAETGAAVMRSPRP